MTQLLLEREINSGYKPSHLKYIIWHDGNTILVETSSSSSPSSPSSYIYHAVGPLFDQFRSDVSRSLFEGLP